ncbi:MAG: protein kinase [Deltaproteobacteria bacterium]|nr:protein kinase [Deltaproteobacteria bacterium]
MTEDPRYRERALLGEGGMGRVVSADDRVLRREVAVKEALGAPDGPEAQRLRREARITAALDHPGVVPVYDLGEDADGRPYYVMRLVRGQSLGEAIEARSSYEEREHLLRGFLAAVEAIAFAHAANVVHRDIKPDNILVGPWGETQVMDWGLARTLDEDEWDAVVSKDFKTRLGAVLGTPAYMSPEQASGEEVGPGLDVWALGAVLYEILAGQRPFRGPSQREMIAQILSGSRTSLSVLVPEVDPGLVTIVDRALARDPADRYADAGEMALALEGWFEGRREMPGKATPTRLWPRGAALLAALVVGAGAGDWFGSHDPVPGGVDERIVQDALVLQARQASADGNRTLAESLAADALERGEHPGARGVLAAHGLDATPRLLTSVPTPVCQRSLLSVTGEFVLCVGRDQLLAHDFDGTERWRLPVATSLHSLDPDGSKVLAYNEGSHRWLMLDARTGASDRLDGTRVSVSGRRGFSRFPRRHVSLQNGRDQRFFTATALAGREVENIVPCGGGGLEWAGELVREGEYVIICSGGRTVRRAVDGTETQVLPPLERDSIAWTGVADPAGRWLLTGGVEGDLVLSDLQEGRRVVSIELSERMIRQVTISDDGALLAAMDTTGRGWVIPREHPDLRYRLPGEVRRLGFMPDGTLLVGRTGRLERWEVPAPTRWARRTLPNGLFDVAWGAEGIAAVAEALLVLSDDGALSTRLNLADLAPDLSVNPPPELRSVAWTPDGALLLAGRGVGLLRVEKGKASRVLPSANTIYLLASGHRFSFEVGLVSPYLMGPDGEEIPGGAIPGWQPLSAEVSGDGTHAAVLGRLGDLYLAIDGAPPRFEALPSPSGVRSVVVTNDGETLYYTSREGVMVRGAREPDASARLLIPRPRAGNIRLDSQGQRLFLGTSDGTVEVYSMPDAILRLQIAAHSRRVSGMAPSPDGERLATGSWDRTLKLWDLSVVDAEREELVSRVRSRWEGVPDAP